MPVPAKVDSSVWANYAGTYTLDWENTLIVQVREGKLYIYSEEADEEMLCTPISSTRFTTSMGVFDFHVAANGKATALEYGELRTFPLTELVPN